MSFESLDCTSPKVYYTLELSRLHEPAHFIFDKLILVGVLSVATKQINTFMSEKYYGKA